MHSSQREEEAQYAGENLANIEGQRYEDAVKLVTSGGDGHEVAVDVDSLRMETTTTGTPSVWAGVNYSQSQVQASKDDIQALTQEGGGGDDDKVVLCGDGARTGTVPIATSSPIKSQIRSPFRQFKRKCNTDYFSPRTQGLGTVTMEYEWQGELYDNDEDDWIYDMMKSMDDGTKYVGGAGVETTTAVTKVRGHPQGLARGEQLGDHPGDVGVGDGVVESIWAGDKEDEDHLNLTMDNLSLKTSSFQNLSGFPDPGQTPTTEVRGKQPSLADNNRGGAFLSFREMKTSDEEEEDAIAGDENDAGEEDATTDHLSFIKYISVNQSTKTHLR